MKDGKSIPLAAAALALAACLHASWFDRLFLTCFSQGPLIPPFWETKAGLWPSHLKSLFTAVWVTLVFWAPGNALLDRLELDRKSVWETAAMGTAVGSLMCGLLFFLLGALGLLYGRVTFALNGALGLWALVQIFRGIPRNLPAWEDAWDGAAAVATAGVVLLLLPNALVPETFYDSLEYHLALPRLYLLEHRLLSLPDNAFSGVPGLASLLYGWALVFDPLGVGAHALAATFLVKTAGSLWGLASRLGRPAAGAWAGLLLVTLPVAQSLAYMTTAELVWSFYAVNFAGALFAARDAEGRARARWLIVAGLILGAGLSVKNLAWALPLCVWVFPGLKASERFKVCAVAGAVLAPWLVKNLLHYGNPLYPFLHEILRPASDIQPAAAYLGEGARIDWKGAPWTEIAAAPWRMMLYKTKLADSLGPLLLGLAPLLWTIRDQKTGRALLLLAAAAWLPLALAVQLPRYFLAAAALLCLALGWAVCESGRKAKAAVFLAALLCVCVYRGHALPREHWRAFTGAVSFEDYLSHASKPYYHSPLYPAAAAINALPPGGRVLIFGDARGFYLQRPFLASSPFQTSPLERWAEASTDGKELRKMFEAAGVTHLAVNHAEIVRLQKPLSFSPAAKRAVDELFKTHMAREYRLGPEYAVLPGGKETLDRWVEVYRLLSPEEAAVPHAPLSLFDGYSIN